MMKMKKLMNMKKVMKTLGQFERLVHFGSVIKFTDSVKLADSVNLWKKNKIRMMIEAQRGNPQSSNCGSPNYSCRNLDSEPRMLIPAERGTVGDRGLAHGDLAVQLEGPHEKIDFLAKFSFVVCQLAGERCVRGTEYGLDCGELNCHDLCLCLALGHYCLVQHYHRESCDTTAVCR